MSRTGLIDDTTGALVRILADGEQFNAAREPGMTAVAVPDTWPEAMAWDAATRAFIADMSGAKQRVIAALNVRAETTRLKFITPGTGQAMTYLQKEKEARAWTTAADPAGFPIMQAEAVATGMTMDALASLVISMADAWLSVGTAIEANRRRLIVLIENAADQTTLDAIDVNAGWPA